MHYRSTMNLVPAFLFVLLGAACKKDNTTGNTSLPKIAREWNLTLSARNENPAPTGRTETGTVNLQLLTDKTLKYTIIVTGLAASDAITAAHIHTGNAISNGPVVLNFAPVFSGNTATGIVKDLRASFIDSLYVVANELYVNVHSNQVASGLLRGQLNSVVELAVDIPMNSAAEVPAGTSVALGTGSFRLLTDKRLYIKVNVTGLEVDDTLTLAHIHKAAVGANGSVIVPIYAATEEFNTVKIITLDDVNYASLKADAIYFNAHSKRKPGGVVRGQIR